LLLFSASNLLGQSAGQVSGRVIAQTDRGPLPGVNVRIKGTTIGTTTNAEGEYTLTVSSRSDTLIFSFVGFQKQVVPIQGRSQINIEMATGVMSGEELVGVGDGKQKKGNITGSVPVVDAEKLE